MELQEQLKLEAINLGACEEGIASWGEPTIDDLCLKYFKYQDFCIKHDFPSVDVIKQLDQDVLRENGIYASGTGESCEKKEIAVIGDANVTIHVTKPCSITVRHRGTVRVSVDSDVLCYISMYDESKVSLVKTEPNGRIAVSFWGGKIKNKKMVDKIYYKEK